MVVILVDTITIHRREARTQSYTKKLKMADSERERLNVFTYLYYDADEKIRNCSIHPKLHSVDATHTVHLNYYAPDKTPGTFLVS